MKTELFQSCGHCWIFQICWHIDCSTFMASSFKIWNSSTGITSISFVHSDASYVSLDFTFQDFWLYVSDHTFVVIWIMQVFFVQFFCVFLPPSASVRSIPLLSFIVEMATHSSILAWKIPWTDEPGRLPSMGSQRVGHDWVTSLSFFAWNVPLVSLIFSKSSLVFPIL